MLLAKPQYSTREIMRALGISARMVRKLKKEMRDKGIVESNVDFAKVDRLGLDFDEDDVSDDIYAIPEVPRTLNNKKLEVPVKKILMEMPAEKAVNLDSMSNPQSIAYFVELAKAYNQT